MLCMLCVCCVLSVEPGQSRRCMASEMASEIKQKKEKEETNVQSTQFTNRSRPLLAIQLPGSPQREPKKGDRCNQLATELWAGALRPRTLTAR
ncbi:hypothetical protein F5Y14DRAFT_149659 [Nemania sp. NC0429]|nr:hypothetical protein F5Y14DRAFT_149659 [Nemania sp. NC0429]